MKKVLLLLLVAAAVVPASATCSVASTPITTASATAGPGNATLTLTGTANCYLVITNVTADLANESDGSAFTTLVQLRQGNCTGSVEMQGNIGVPVAFGSTDHWHSGPIHGYTTLGGGACIQIVGGETGDTESLTVTYYYSSTQ